MLNKIGFENNKPELHIMVDELFDLMKKLKMDYTNTFWALSQESDLENSTLNRPDFKPWLEKWKDAIDNSNGMQNAKQLMKTHNPAFIPRNHMVEQALDEAVKGDLTLFKRLLSVLSKPYQYQNNSEKFMEPSNLDFEMSYQTFCGT